MILARKFFPFSIAVLFLFLFLIACSKEVSVPDVANQDVEQAKKTLESATLKVGKMDGVPTNVPPGSYVVSQSPKAGEKVSEESTVDLVAQVPVELPDLTNSSVTDAVNTAQALGLKVALVKQPGLNPAGLLRSPKVIRQDPPPSTPVRKDSMVTLTIEAPPNIGALLDRVTKEPGYEKLKPEYREVVDQFLK